MKKRILLVDDHPVVRSGVRGMLNADFDVCGEAADGADAVAKVRELEPDLVILDVNMPVMNGIEAARKIRLIRPQTNILLLSLHDAGLLAEEAKVAGADGVITKASSPAELIQSIRDAFFCDGGTAASALPELDRT